MYGKKPPFSMKPHFPTLNPTNMPAYLPGVMYCISFEDMEELCFGGRLNIENC